MRGLVAALAAVVVTVASPTFAAGAGGWSCNAYGKDGARRGTWQTVSGDAKTSRDAAAQAALATCTRRGLQSCRPSGCWAR